MEMLLTIEQTAQRLQLDQTTVRRQIKRGALRAIKRGRVWRVPESALLESSVTPTAAPVDEVEALLDATGEAIRRAGYKTDADIERLIDEVRAELGHAGQSADAIWEAMLSGGDKRDDALRAMFRAPEGVQAIIMKRSAEVAARHYATPAGEAELADWRALDGEPFHNDGEGD